MIRALRELRSDFQNRKSRATFRIMELNSFVRYQAGFKLNMLYPHCEGFCACGCNRPLAKNRKKWFSDDCRNKAFINFAIIKGDVAIIRQELFKIDAGACRSCGSITNTWQADHILPVHQGGSAASIENFQTLCLECHQEKTNILIYSPSVLRSPRTKLQYATFSFSLTRGSTHCSAQIRPPINTVFCLSVHSCQAV